MGDGEAAERIRAAGLDVLVDLKGYTQDSRTGILARRPAPLQVAYLGFPGSMGADFIDYMVADEVVVPAAERGHCDERIIYLPGSYQPNDDRRAIAATVPTRAELGLPEDGFVFCSFNASYKLTPHEFDIWMRLLGQVEGSILWLLAGNDATRANLRAEAERRGISGERLVYAGRLPQAEHLARIGQADLFVDTFRVNAHTTMSDALWAGLPAVTLAGRQFAARVGASVLEAAGLPELVARDAGEYEALCLALARDPARLAGYRQHLTENRGSLSLFDTVAYARKFEAGIAAAVERARQGLAPADLRIS
jgi:predicted O-linked N-acetylglucosamine transferase (SPINDLY family)